MELELELELGCLQWKILLKVVAEQRKKLCPEQKLKCGQGPHWGQQKKK